MLIWYMLVGFDSTESCICLGRPRTRRQAHCCSTWHCACQLAFSLIMLCLPPILRPTVYTILSIALMSNFLWEILMMERRTRCMSLQVKVAWPVCAINLGQVADVARAQGPLRIKWGHRCSRPPSYNSTISQVQVYGQTIAPQYVVPGSCLDQGSGSISDL